MTIFLCFPCPKFFLSGIWGSVSHKGRISFLNPLLNLLLRFSQLYLFGSVWIFSRLCMRSHPALHTPTHAHTSQPPHSRSHMRHAQPDSWPCPPGGRGWRPVGRGVFVGGDEPGSSALSPDIHTQWVHTHTCLIAWPIGGGAHWGWCRLKSEDRRIAMVWGSSQSLLTVFSLCILSLCFKISW